MANNALTPINPDKVEAFDAGFRSSAEKVAIGQWYWVSEEVRYDGQWTRDDGSKMKEGEFARWLGCVMKIGSNFVELEAPSSGRSSGHSLRVHFDDFEKTLEFEPNADAHIQSRIQNYQAQVKQLLGEVQAVTARLGVVPKEQIAGQAPAAGENALVVVSGQADTHGYKNALIEAKDKTLPELFKAIEEANAGLAKWMLAPTLPTKATIGPMKDNIEQIEDRIYTIELYAGLTEEAIQCSDGEPAAMGEKLRVMQRRLYMDEESLLSYRGGGMEFKDIGEFDKWIAEPENRDRLLPFPRCLVAFRVRRFEKDREDGGDLWRAWTNFNIAQADKFTFMYVRNGEQVWRIVCDFEVDEMIIPDRGDFDPSEPMMVKLFCGQVKDMMPRQRWEAWKAEQDEQRRKYDEWKKANPKASWINNPYHNSVGFRNEADEYEPFDPSNVYFDETHKHLEAMIKKYNRIAVIIQGLFDRSMVLHPHPPVRVWDAMSFEQSIELIYDATTLTHGDPPDFEAFRRELNASLNGDSVVTGQQDYWMRIEAQKENKRIKNDWRNRDRRANYTRFVPYGNPGPGLVSKMAEWRPRARKALFRWERETQGWRTEHNTAPATILVPADELFNVSAYKPGDFKRFFADPRTRRDYLKWAPLMLAAEDYHAGKIQLGEFSKGGDRRSSW